MLEVWPKQSAGRINRRELTVPDLGLWWLSSMKGDEVTQSAGSVWAKWNFTHSLSTQEETFKDRISFSLLKSQARSPAKGRGREEWITICPQVGCGTQGTCTCFVIGTGRVPPPYSTCPCIALGTLSNRPFVFLSSWLRSYFRQNELFICNKYSCTKCHRLWAKPE